MSTSGEQSSRSIYDLITVSEIDDASCPAVLEDIKPVAEIYEELQSSNVTAQLSFHGGIKLSHILNKLGGAINRQELDGEEAELDNALTESDRSFLYGVYLIR